MHLAIVVFGSYGDHFPAWQIGRAAALRGHRVSIIGSEKYLREFDSTGIEYHFVLSMEEFVVRAAQIADGSAGQRIAVFREAARMFLRRAHAILSQLDFDAGGVIIAPQGPGCRPALMVREQRSIPVLELHFDPQSLLDVSRNWRARWERWFILKALRWLTLKDFNAFRRECQLAAVSDPEAWAESQIDAACGLYPDFMANVFPSRPLPYPLRLTGYTMTEVAPQPPSPEIEAFLNAGPPPVVVSKPSWLAKSDAFFAETAVALRQSGLRGLFTGAASTTTDGEDILRVPFARHQDFLPRACAFIHHGGAGTTGAGLYAAVPQLIVPQAPMQQDVGRRVAKLGIGDMLEPKRYRGRRIGEALTQLTTTASIAERCRELSQTLHQSGPKSTDLICDEAEALARRGLRRP